MNVEVDFKIKTFYSHYSKEIWENKLEVFQENSRTYVENEVVLENVGINVQVEV